MDGRTERIEDEFSSQMRRHCSADDATTEQLEDNGEEQKDTPANPRKRNRVFHERGGLQSIPARSCHGLTKWASREAGSSR